MHPQRNLERYERAIFKNKITVGQRCDEHLKKQQRAGFRYRWRGWLRRRSIGTQRRWDNRNRRRRPHWTIKHKSTDYCYALYTRTEERIKDINPSCAVKKFQTFYLPEIADQFDFTAYDYVVDCIDTIVAKIDIITRCHNLRIPMISSMGAAFKLDATQFEVTDLFKTINDPLAKVLRKKLRKTNVRNVKVVYSPEEPLTSLYSDDNEDIDNDVANIETIAHKKRSTPASNAWVPATAGLIIGGEVIKDLCKAAKTMRKTDINK